MRLYFLLLLLLVACATTESTRRTVDVTLLATVLNNRSLPVINKDINVESFKMLTGPMMRTYAWQIRTTDKNGQLRYYVNYDIRKNEKIRFCILSQCTDVSYEEALNNITKEMTVKDRREI